MDNFDKISLEEISKQDLLLILQALTYTHENTKIDDFISLRDSILKELEFLTNFTPEQILKTLEG